MEARLLTKYNLLKRGRALGVLAALLLVGLTSCQNDNISSDKAYTFTGETVANYLENRPEKFSEYYAILKRCKVSDESTSTLNNLLNSYGSFTCFAPNNDAMKAYYKKYGFNSFDEMLAGWGEVKADSAISVIAKMHIINATKSAILYESKNFTKKISDPNMYDKTIYIADTLGTYILNDVATILTKDIEAYNGVVHEVDAVLEPSDLKLSGFLAKYPQYSIFSKALDATGVSNRVNTVPEDYNYSPNEDIDVNALYAEWDRICEQPDKRKQCYTCFIEPNDVYAAALPSLKAATSSKDTLDIIRDYAKDWYKEAYSDASFAATNINLPDADKNSPLNLFVAYHFVNKKIDKEDFTTYVIGLDPTYARIQEFAETLAPNQMIYMSAGQRGNMYADAAHKNQVCLNPGSTADDVPWYDTTPTGRARILWTHPGKEGCVLSGTSYETENGYFHELKSLLTYPRQDFKKIRFRMDVASLFPEMMSNNIRYRYPGNKGRIYIPQGYLTGITNLSSSTVLIYINPNTTISAGGGYNGYQGDEMFARGSYDFVIKLPGIPRGDYEVRMGFTTSPNRGCVQFYMGTDADYTKLTPTGIPVDLTQGAPKHGWIADTGSDGDYDGDKAMRAMGWMKGPNSWRCNNGKNTRSLRETENATASGHSSIRYILGKAHLETDGSVYIRCRSTVDLSTVELMWDYFEICPASIYDNPENSEPRD